MASTLSVPIYRNTENLTIGHRVKPPGAQHDDAAHRLSPLSGLARVLVAGQLMSVGTPSPR